MVTEETITSPTDKPVIKKRGRPRKIIDTSVEKTALIVKVDDIARKVAVENSAMLSKIKDTDKNKYTFAVGRRKKAIARIFLYKSGNGEIEVNTKPSAEYFGRKNLQEVIRRALQHSPFKKSARIIVKVRGGGLTGQAEAIQLGIANALLKIDETLRPTLRARGYLTRDSRRKERKKPGLKKARRAPQFSKR